MIMNNKSKLGKFLKWEDRTKVRIKRKVISKIKYNYKKHTWDVNITVTH